MNRLAAEMVDIEKTTQRRAGKLRRREGFHDQERQLLKRDDCTISRTAHTGHGAVTAFAGKQPITPTGRWWGKRPNRTYRGS